MEIEREASGVATPATPRRNFALAPMSTLVLSRCGTWSLLGRLSTGLRPDLAVLNQRPLSYMLISRSIVCFKDSRRGSCLGNAV
jgi:hypothetical protein